MLPQNKLFRKQTYDNGPQLIHQNLKAPLHKNKKASSQNNPIRTANVDQLQLAFDQFITTNRLRKNSLPAQQQNTEDSMTSQDSGLQNFLFYNQDQFPADLNKAIMHGQAQRVCKAINYNYYHGRRCECCGKAIDNQQLSMCDHPNSMKHIGNCYPLYFLFVKQCFIFVLIQLFVQAVPTLIVYSRGTYCQQLEATFICYWSFLNIFNQKNNETNQYVLVICNFASIFLQLILIQIFKIYQGQTLNRMEKDRKTVSDYSIIIKDFPSNVPLEALEDILEKNVPGSKKQIVRMFLLYDLRSYSEGRKERKKIIDKINYLQMKNSLFQNNPNFTVTQKINRQETCDMEIAVLESQKECIEDQLHEITQILNEQAKKNIEHLRNISIDSNYTNKHMKYNMTFSGKIIITFQTNAIQKTVVKTFKKRTIEKFIQNFQLICKWCSKFLYRKYFILNHRLKIKQAPEPSDILWTEIVSVQNKVMNRLKSDIIIFFCIVIDLIILLYFKVKIKNYQKSQTAVMQLFLNLCSASLVALANVIIGITIRRYAQKEERTTQTSYFVQVGRKLIKMFMVNMLLTIFLGNIIFWYYLGYFNNRGHGVDKYNLSPLLSNLIGEYFFLFITNSYISSIMSLLDVMWFKRLIQRKIAKNQLKKKICKKSQQDLNKLFEGHPVDMALRYANVLKVVLYTSAISTVIPIGVPMCLVGIFIIYWSDKYLLYRRMVCNNYISNDLQKKMTKLMHLSTLFFAIGNFITQYLPQYDNFETSFSSKLERKQYLLVSALGIVIALTFQYIPFRKVSIYYLYKKFSPTSKKYSKYKSYQYSQIIEEINEDYDLYHPASRDKVLQAEMKNQQKKGKILQQNQSETQKIIPEAQQGDEFSHHTIASSNKHFDQTNQKIQNHHNIVPSDKQSFLQNNVSKNSQRNLLNRSEPILFTKSSSSGQQIELSHLSIQVDESNDQNIKNQFKKFDHFKQNDFLEQKKQSSIENQE